MHIFDLLIALFLWIVISLVKSVFPVVWILIDLMCKDEHLNVLLLISLVRYLQQQIRRTFALIETLFNLSDVMHILPHFRGWMES